MCLVEHPEARAILATVRFNFPTLPSVLTALLAMWLALLPGGAGAQVQKTLRVGVIKFVSHPALDADAKGFEAALAHSGFVEGVNLEILRHDAQGDPARAESAARALGQAQVDLIHTIATPSTQAAVRVAANVPIVFSAVTDPLSAGVVPPHILPGQKTGTRVTGVSDMWPIRRQLEAYARALPQVKRWGTVYNPQEANSVRHLQILRQAASQLGLTLIEVQVTHGSQVSAAALSLVGRVEAILHTADNTTAANLEALIKVCEQHRLPLFAGDVESVSRGAIAAYGNDYYLVGYAAGKKASLVLKGVKPGSIPWGPIEKYSLVVNARAVKAMGARMPEGFLGLADRVIH